MTKVLITRKKEKSGILENKGFLTVYEPLFLVEKNSEKLFFEKVDFVIITSANAADSIAQSNLDRNVKIYAVGKKTAESLEQLGFKNIIYPEETNAVALKKLILQKEKLGFGLYFRGSIISLDFKKELQQFGFAIEEITAYKIIENKNFSPDLLDFAKKEKFDLVLIFSKNSAKIFHKLAKRHNLLEYFKESKILALSEKICSEIRNLGFLNVRTFTKNFHD